MAGQTPELRFERWRTLGDAAALSDVFDALAPGLLRLAIHLVGDAAAAEDLVQQTFVTAMERAASWDARRPLEPWLQGILANHARDLRKLARRAHDPDFDLEAVLARAEDAPIESASRRELSGELARAVDALEEPYRAAVLLRLRHGMEAADIAHVLGRSPGAVRVQLHRARELLKRALPAGIASALVILAESARGLERVRNQVLTEAARLAPAAEIGGLVGGAIVMKKIVVAAFMLMLALALLLTLRSEPELEQESAIVAQVASGLEQPDFAIAPPTPLASEERRAESIDTRAVTAEIEHLRGIVLDADTDLPVAGARIALYAPIVMTVQELRARYWDRLSIADYFGMRKSGPWPYYDTPDSSRVVVPEFSPMEALGFEPILVRAPPAADTAPYAETTSRPDGRFDLAAATTDAFLTCDADGYAQRAFATQAGRRGLDPAADRTIYVSKDRPLRGRIVDSQGEPIRASIALSLHGDAPKRMRLPGDLLIDRQERSVLFYTDQDGRFDIQTDARVANISSADARWRATPFRCGRLQVDGVEVKWGGWIDLVDETGDVLLQLEPACSILVRDAETRGPIEDAYVALYTSDLRLSLREGWFHLEGGRFAVPPSMAYATHLPEKIAELHVATTIRVWAPGYAEGTADIADMFAANVHEIDLVRDASAPITGRVRRSGRDVVGARVVVFRSQDGPSARVEARMPIAGAVSADDGTFALSIPPGRHVLVVEHEADRVRRGLDVPVAGELDVDLDASAVLEVQLANEDGRASADRYVRVLDTDAIWRRETTDATGLARFDGLLAGPTTIQVSHLPISSGFRVDATRIVDLAAGSTSVQSFIVPGANSKFARLVIEDGSPVGWTVSRGMWSTGEGAAIPSFAVEIDGRIPLDFAVDRSFVLSSPHGKTKHWITMPRDAADGAEVRVRVGGIGFRGRAVDAVTGEPMRAVVVMFTPDDGSRGGWIAAPVSGDGSFEAVGIANIHWRAQLHSLTGSSADLPGDVIFELPVEPTDPPAQLLLRYPRFLNGEYGGHPHVTLKGSFPPDALSIASGASVSLTSRLAGDGCPAWAVCSAKVGIDGRFRMRVPMSDEWWFSAWAGEPTRRIVHERWTPTGADPEVREFTLLPR